MSSSTKKAPSCPICLGHFTKVIRQPVACPYCPSKTCRTCTQQYLLNTMNDPHCHSCKREWNREFIDTHLTQTFRKGPLRQQRRKILMDRETGRLPAMQIFVEAQIVYDRTGRRSYLLAAERKKIKAERHVAQLSFDPGSLSAEQVAELMRPFALRLAENRKALDANYILYNNAMMVLTGRSTEAPRQFVMKCPGEDCRGFLSSAWKCGTCQKSFCSDCHARKQSHKDEEHVCEADAKATASMISKETRPCPKCGIRISKIDGCDQMWCTGCHTTFSWNSGQILLNTITHNPHYYEYLRKANNGEIPREAGDVPCGGLPHAWQFSRMILELSIPTAEKTTILECLRCLSDLVDVRLPRFPSRQVANANQAADIQYLTNKLTKDEWGVILERTENTFEKGKEIGLILQTLVHVGSEKMALIHNVAIPSALKRKLEREAMIPGILADMEKVRDFTNRSLWAKGLQMGAVVPHISKEWAYVWIRKSDMKNPVYIDDRPADAAAPILETTGPEEAEAPLPVAAAPVAAAPVEVDADVEGEGEEMIYVELENGELVQMPLTQARQLIFVERTAALIGI